MMDIPGYIVLEARLVPAPIIRLVEELGSLVIIDAVYGETFAAEKEACFGADQPKGTGNQETLFHDGRTRDRTPAFTIGGSGSALVRARVVPAGSPGQSVFAKTGLGPPGVLISPGTAKLQIGIE